MTSRSPAVMMIEAAIPRLDMGELAAILRLTADEVRRREKEVAVHREVERVDE